MGAVVLVAWDDVLQRTEGLLLVAAMAVVSVFLVLWSRRDVRDGLAGATLEDDADAMEYRATRELAKAFASLVGIVVGAWLLVEGGGNVADHYGLAGGFVGATIFALGPAFPNWSQQVRQHVARPTNWSSATCWAPTYSTRC